VHLDAFELHRPESLAEAVDLSRRLGAQADLLAGGTDLLPNYKMRLNVKPHLIALDRVAELTRRTPEWIGAMVRLADLEADPELGRRYPALREAVEQVATPLVRASGTLGGNLLVETRCFFFNQGPLWRESLGYCLKAEGDRCHVVPQKERCYATFSGDLAPALLALGASVELAGAEGARTIPLDALYDAEGDGIRRTRLRPGELVVGVRLPPEAARARSTYRKLRIRPSFDFPELGVAAALWTEGGHVVRLELAVGGLETYPRRLRAITEPLAGAELSDARIEEVALAAAKAVRPVHNTTLDPAYRKKMTAVFVRRSLRALREGATPGGAGA
jgi:4-hydroxybenzoyl-CoA reductase subunit beta